MKSDISPSQKRHHPPLLTAALVAALGCGGAEDARAVDGGAADATALGDTDPPAITIPCKAVMGWAATPATPGSRWSETRRGGPTSFQGLGGQSWVPFTPDRVQAETLDGRTIDCPVSNQVFECRDDQVLRSVTAFAAGQSATNEYPFYDRDGRCNFALAEHSFQAAILYFKNLSSCVSPESVVVEGELRGYDGLQPTVWLLGAVQPRHSEGVTGDIVFRPCEVTGDRYRCLTLGYRNSAMHTVAVSATSSGLQKPVLLEVNDCAVTPVVLDFDRAATVSDGGAPADASDSGP